MRLKDIIAEDDRPIDRAKLTSYDWSTIKRRIRRYDRDEDQGFYVLRHLPSNQVANRPLIIVVHPGDLITYGHTYRDDPPEEIELARRTTQFSKQVQNGTAEDINRWRAAGADVAVLHRGSCSQFHDKSARNVSSILWKALGDSWKAGTVLYGDDLDAAGAWIIQNLHIKERPHIYLAGAYSTPDSGCLTHIGRQIEAVVGPDKITVSDHSPPDNGPDPGRAWRPGT